MHIQSQNIKTKDIMSHYHTCTTVSLLRRPITNGRLSLYLDFYPAIRNPETMNTARIRTNISSISK